MLYQTVVFLSCLSVFLSVLSVCDVYVLWPNGWMDQDETWRGDRPWPRSYYARWGPSSPSQKRHNPQFSDHICCDQTAGWIKMPLGTAVDLGPGDIVLDGDPASPPKKEGALHPQLWPMYCGQTAAWIKMPLGTG